MESKRKIVFATNNAHKLEEIREIMGDSWQVLSLSDIDCHDDIPETADTLEGNGCFADDTGLLVNALDGAPGVYSARYAGPGHDSAANMALLLRNMRGKDNRKARFSTVIALIEDSSLKTFEGSVSGEIIEEAAGTEGFGYDPVFRPDGYDVTFAQMSAEEKNAISHRGRAVARLIDYLLEKK